MPSDRALKHAGGTASGALRDRVGRRVLGGALVAITALTGAGCDATHTHDAPNTHEAARVRANTPTSNLRVPGSTAAPSTSDGTTTTTARATGCAGGFNATSVSFSDPLHGWTIGAIDDDPACYVSRARPLPAATTPISARVSTDGGTLWQPRGRVPGRAAHVVARSGAEAWVWGPDLAHTTDGGRHWTTLDAGDSTVGLSVENDSVWWLSLCHRKPGAQVELCFARSDDDGTTWQHSVAPVGDLQTGANPQLAQLVRSDPLHGWLLAANADSTIELWRTRDGARSWQLLPMPCSGPTSAHPPVAMGDAHPGPELLTVVDARHLFVMCAGSAADGSQGKVVLASTDAGGSWKWTGANPELAGYPAAMATPGLDTIVWTGPRTELNASFDGGRTWIRPASTDPRVAFDPADGGLGPIVFASPQDGWTIGQYTGPGSVIWRTRDGGHTWSPTVVR